MIEKELEKLNTMKTPELKKMFLKYFRYTPIKRGKEFYVSSLAYRMQELEFGGLSATTKNLLVQIGLLSVLLYSANICQINLISNSVIDFDIIGTKKSSF